MQWLLQDFVNGEREGMHTTSAYRGVRRHFICGVEDNLPTDISGKYFLWVNLPTQ